MEVWREVVKTSPEKTQTPEWSGSLNHATTYVYIGPMDVTLVDCTIFD